MTCSAADVGAGAGAPVAAGVAGDEGSRAAGGGGVAVDGARGGRWTVGRLLQWVAVIWISAVAVVAGVELRRATFVVTQDVRFTGDIDNAFNQGGAVYEMAQRDAGGRIVNPTPTLGQVLGAYVRRYDVVEARGEGRYGLDYPPARLLVMTLWVYHVRSERPGAERWMDEDLWPLLGLNTVMGGLASVGVFLLVRYWRGGGGVAGNTATEVAAPRGALCPKPLWVPLGCAVLMWFNPAVLVNGHMWPQWDVWPVAFYVWAAYFCSRGWWFSAGATIAVGCMFKGQLLIVTPVLILWPLLRGQLGAVARELIGFAFTMAALTAVWSYGGAEHGWWIATTAVAAVTVLVVRRLAAGRSDALPLVDEAWPRGWPRGWAIAGAVLVGLGVVVQATWPWLRAGDALPYTYGVLLCVGLALPLVFVRQVRIGLWAAGLATVVLFLGAVRFDGSFGWLKVGFVHGADQHQGMYIGMAYNLAGILQDSYGWRLGHRVEWLGDEGTPIKAALKYLFAATVPLMGIAAALQSWRGSARMLVVLAAPWLVMFATLAQMHERYLLYAAAVSAIWAGYNAGFALLHVLLSLVAAGLMWRQQPGNWNYWPELNRLIQGFTPGMGWAILLLAAMCLYVCLTGWWRWPPIGARPGLDSQRD